MPRRPRGAISEVAMDRIWDAAFEEGYDQGYRRGFTEGEGRAPRGRRQPGPRVAAYKKRKTAYQNAYSAAYKRLKKKHPRMAFGSLSKKAHAAARKKVK